MTTTDRVAVVGDGRADAIFADVVAALTDIIRKHQVTWPEWRAAVEWLTLAGTQPFEIPLMLDVFLSQAVDDVNAAEAGTESNIEGPFYIPDAPVLDGPNVLPMRDDEPGEQLFFSGTVRSTAGAPLAGATLDVWQANGAGEYSHFSPGVPEYNLRGRLTTDADGRYEFETVVPAGYEIPKAGATGMLLAALGKPCFRPAHLHFLLTHEAAQPLTTQLYIDGDPYIDRDVVVGAVKDSLVTKLEHHVAGDGRPYATGTFDFVLASVTG
jgi:catechol 1,2-dioxygenase